MDRLIFLAIIVTRSLLSVVLKIVFLSITTLFYLSAGQPVPVTGFPPSIQCHEGTKESDVVDEAEEDSRGSVHTEGLDRAERRHEADVESQDVGQGGDGDGHSRLFVSFCHAVLNLVTRHSPLPAGNHDEHVINTDPLENNSQFVDRSITV